MKLFRSIHSARYSFLEHTELNKFLERMSFDVEKISNILVSFLPEIVSIPVMFVGTVYLMLRINYMFTISILVIIPVYYIIVVARSFALRRLNKKLRSQIENLKTSVEESFRATKILRAFDFQRRFNQNRYRDALRKMVRLEMNIWKQTLIYNWLSKIVSSGWSLAITWGVLYLLFINRLQVGETLALGGYIAILQRPFIKIQQIYASLVQASVSAERILELTDQSSPTVKVGEANIIVQNGIKINNMSFSYSNENPLFKGFNLRIERGETIVIIGPTGSGKTTLLKLLVGYYENYRGQIYLDNIELRQIKNNCTKNLITLVAGDYCYFRGSILENCQATSDEHALDCVKAVAKQIGFHDWIESLKHRYNTNIGIGGVNLSSGESQKIALLRALVKNPPILMLDEISSCIDNKAEACFLQGLIDLRPKDGITVIVTHRLSLSEEPWVDRILFLDNGKIRECTNIAQSDEHNSVYLETSTLVSDG